MSFLNVTLERVFEKENTTLRAWNLRLLGIVTLFVAGHISFCLSSLPALITNKSFENMSLQVARDSETADHMIKNFITKWAFPFALRMGHNDIDNVLNDLLV
jgi:hypothetical protein